MILLQFFYIFSYFTDGFAYAGEALVGKFVGAHDSENLRSVVMHLFKWGAYICVPFAILYALFPTPFVKMISDQPIILEQIQPYYIYMVLIPIITFAAFLWDGIYIGATAGRQVRDCMIVSAVAFMAVYLAFRSLWGIQALYAAYFAHLLARAASLTILWPKVFREQELN